MSEEMYVRIEEGAVSLEAAVTHGTGKRGAIVCHPWGMLGGSMHDPTVAAARRGLLDAGFSVLRFNFRGVGDSKGWSSLTGSGEKEDLRTACNFLLNGSVIGGRKLEPVEQIILVGFSFGSVITGSLIDEIPAVRGGCAISYPYSVMWALVSWNSSTFWNAFQDSKKPKLFVYGDSDNFTSKSSLDKAAGKLTEPKEIQCFQETDHFWFGRHKELSEKIAEWSSRVCPP